jgi:hypothetical protein
MRNKLFYSILFFLFVVSACKIGKKTVGEENLVDNSLKDLISATESKLLHYKDLKIKYTGKINTQSTKLNLSGQIRIIHDSLIWMNATALLGIEAGRVLITKDTVFLQDNFKASIKVFSVEQFADSFGITARLDVLEKLLLGEFARMELGNYQRVEDLAVFTGYFQYMALYLGNNNTIDYKAYLGSAHYRVDSMFVRDLSGGKSFRLDYGDYVSLDNILLPSQLSVQFGVGEQISSAELLYKKLTFDENTTNPGLSSGFVKIKM